MQPQHHCEGPAWLSDKDRLAWRCDRGWLENAWLDHYGDKNFDKFECQVQFGYGAARNSAHQHWDEEVDQQLKASWGGDWNADKGYIRRGWELTRKGQRYGSHGAR